MNENIKIDVAIEIIALKIANKLKEIEKEDSSKKQEELEQLISERDEMYAGNTEITDKIINIYGAEIKEMYSKV